MFIVGVAVHGNGGTFSVKGNQKVTASTSAFDDLRTNRLGEFEELFRFHWLNCGTYVF